LHTYSSKRRGLRVLLLAGMCAWQLLFKQGHRNKLARAVIKPVGESPWRDIYNSTDDDAWLVFLALRREDFRVVTDHASLVLASPPRSALREDDIVAIALHYLHTTDEQTALCQEFGVVPATLSYALSAGLRALMLSLPDLPDARITWPTDRLRSLYAEAMESYAAARYPDARITRAWGMVDGLSIPTCTTAATPR
jgi:hypothetical protein